MKKSCTETFGSKLRRLRLENGMNQSDVAKAIGAKQSSISEWEHDNPMRKPSYEAIVKLSNLFGENMAIPDNDKAYKIRNILERMATDIRFREWAFEVLAVTEDEVAGLYDKGLF